MTRIAPLLLSLLVISQTHAGSQETNSLRGTSAISDDILIPDLSAETDLQFKFPFDKNFFRTPSRRKLQKKESTTMIDLNIRFNKFAVDGDFVNINSLPLTAYHYPIRSLTAVALKNYSNAASVICEGDFALPPDHTEKLLNYIEEIGGFPSMPSFDTNSSLDQTGNDYWDEFRKVAQLQYGRRQDIEPETFMRAPDLWQTSRPDMESVAYAVFDEYPGSLQQELIMWLWSQKAPPDYEIIPFRSKSDFVGVNIAMADLNTWAIGAVSPMNFYAKWYVGRPRPEEVAYAIATRELSAGVPPDVVELIDQLDLKTPEQFTAYPVGSPRHPSWPAMHSAASSASFWLAVMMDLTDEQYCEALRVDYAVAFARTCAGVHYPTDNIAGLNLGQAIVADLLPAHLEELYGSDPVKVQAKIKKLRFDWNDFDSFTCEGAPMPSQIK